MDRRPHPSERDLRRALGAPVGSAAVLLLAGLTALLPAAAAGQDAGAASDDRTLRALSLEETGPATDGDGSGGAEPAVRVDGRLAEAAWEQASAATDFRQREPDEGDPATEGTEVRVAYGTDALYVAIRARDSRAEEVIARTLERDRIMRDTPFGSLRFRGDDAVAILFDTFHDHRNGIVFATNPNGAQFDALVTDQGQQINVEWRAVWEVEAHRTEGGWTAEFRIPFRTLRYPSGDLATGRHTWGFNVSRMIRRKNEQALWSSWSRDGGGFLKVSRAGELTGLRDLPRSGLNLEVQPYVLSGVEEQRTAAGTPTDMRLKVGGSAKYELRPGLVLDLTANPDFAQVEVDREQVNLTRFSLFFPEKRDFFLENAGIFDFGLRGFGNSPPPFLLFFSRRIGFHEGQTVPLMAGARLSGRIGDQTVGFLDAVTDEEAGLPRSNHGVLRVKRDVGEDGYVGAMATDLRRGLGSDPGGGRDTTSASAAADNTTGGIDWSLWTGDRMNWRGFLAGTTTGGEGGDGLAYRLAGEYNSDFWRIRTGHLFVGPETNADMGFVRRRDIRKSDGFFMIRPRPDALGLRVVHTGISGEHVTGEDWGVKDWEVGPFISPEWDSGEDIRLTYDRTFTRLEEPFELADQVTVPAGEYDMWQVTTRVETSSNRPVWGNVRFQYRSFYGGTLVSTGGELNLEAGAHVGLQGRYRHNDVDTPWGDFESDVVSLNLRWAASTQLTGNVRFQYNSLDERINTKARVRLIHQPGSDLYLVVSEQRGPSFVETAGAGVRRDGSSGGLPDRLRPGIRATSHAPGAGGDLWDVRTRNAVVKLTYLLRL